MAMPPSERAASASSQRLFVALWPDDDVRARLARVAQDLRPVDGRLVPVRNLHLTLAFLGESDAARRACIEQALSAVGAGAFTLAFGTVRYRRRSAMVWLEARTVPPALRDLADAAHSALAPCGHAPETRPFRAHVTLARNARRLAARPTEISFSWRVEDFCLVSSKLTSEGSVYAVERRWPLTP